MQQLTEKQTWFITEVKERFQNDKWSVSSFAKQLEPPSTWNNFKLILLEYCMEQSLYFLETKLFFHVGRSHNICMKSDVVLTEHLSNKPLPASMVANQAEINLG